MSLVEVSLYILGGGPIQCFGLDPIDPWSSLLIMGPGADTKVMEATSHPPTHTLQMLFFSSETDPLYYDYIDTFYDEVISILDDGLEVEIDDEKYIFVPAPHIRFDGKGNK